MFEKMIRNRKGTAEVIGSIMFIVILLFFFTNVYLWHDAATKEMNDLYVQKINSPVTLAVESTSPFVLNVTNNGGLDAKVVRVWVCDSVSHNPYNVGDNGKVGLVIRAGSSALIENCTKPSGPAVIKVVTTVGNIAACDYSP
jgi:hypothetical protein